MNGSSVGFLQGEEEFQTAFAAVIDRDGASERIDGVFDDRKPETRSPGFTRTSGIDAVESLEKMRNVFLADSLAVVPERECIEIFRFRHERHADAGAS